MSHRRITFDGDEWEAIPDNIGGGSATGWAKAVDITDWSVTFRCLSNPARGKVVGNVAHKDLSKVLDDQLERALALALRTVDYRGYEIHARPQALQDGGWNTNLQIVRNAEVLIP